MNLAGEAGRLGRQRFRTGELIEDEDLPTVSWYSQYVFTQVKLLLIYIHLGRSV